MTDSREIIFPHGPYRRPRVSWIDTRLWFWAIALTLALSVAGVVGWGLWLARAANPSLGGAP